MEPVGVYWNFKGCGRCGADTYVDSDTDGWYEQCLLCSTRREFKDGPPKRGAGSGTGKLEVKVSEAFQRSIPDNIVATLRQLPEQGPGQTAHSLSESMGVDQRVVQEWLDILVDMDYVRETNNGSPEGSGYLKDTSGTGFLTTLYQTRADFKQSLKPTMNRGDILSEEGMLMDENGILTRLGKYAVDVSDEIQEIIDSVRNGESLEVQRRKSERVLS